MLAYYESLFKLIQKQSAVDNVFEKLDRRIFCLPSRVDYKSYVRNLGTLKFKENGLGTSVETTLTINWHSLIPEEWVRLNRNLLVNLKSETKLKSDFFRDQIMRQTLIFDEGVEASILFEIFSSNSGWERVYKADAPPYIKSTDGKYSLFMITHESEFSFINSIIHLMLVYK